ncbi:MULTISPECIES: choice-of-anchor I family protein [Acinetobacter]|uniref:choice-of-anchor I family protein n=1 Tax=Acinetobacter TaxID=469 RepID=UPI00144468CF|nr:MULTISPECIES: choice-of-anchor I family protein [Acinetobacter]MDM1487507.1 alkaline phosphatase [Acinetobacter towneri]
MKTQISALMLALLSVGMVGCNDDNDPIPVKVEDEKVVEATPNSIQLEYVSRYESGIFDQSAAEIPAYDAESQRVFMVNAEAGELDVIDLSDVTNPIKTHSISAQSIARGASVNSVSIHNGILAIAVEAAKKTDKGWVAFYRASDLRKLSHVQVGALPDMLTFTPDGKKVLVANEGEPSDNYQVDPEGSISIIDVSAGFEKLTDQHVKTADFKAWDGKEAELRSKGVRIYGPNANATASQDFEPEYITLSADGKTAWATLQENNALAKIDVATATVIDILPLGYKHYGTEGNGIDASDDPKGINIQIQPNIYGMYLPDAIGSYEVNGKTYLVTANEGDARAWGEDNKAYFQGDDKQGFVEEFRVKHLVHKDGFDRRAGDDLPPQLRQLAAGALLNPVTFAWCGATQGNAGDCRADAQLGRLNISWTMGYEQDATGAPVMYNVNGEKDPLGDRLMYNKLYSYGARSVSIWDENGVQVWDSGDAFEQYLASDLAKFGQNRNINAKDFFNTGHDEGNALDSRSDAKGPEPEGLTLGKIGQKTFVFIGLERTGGVMVYDITDPKKPVFQDYLNTREDFIKDPATEFAAGRGSTIGDLGPEGLTFIAAKDSPNGKPLLVVGNEVSGTTAVYQIKLN